MTNALLAAERGADILPPPSVVRRAAGRFGGRTGADARHGCGPGTGPFEDSQDKHMGENVGCIIHFLDSLFDLG